MTSRENVNPNIVIQENIQLQFSLLFYVLCIIWHVSQIRKTQMGKFSEFIETDESVKSGE